MPKLIADAVDASETGVANGMNMVVRIVGGVIGAQIGAVLLASHALPGGVPGEQGFVDAFWVSAVGGLLGAVAAALVLPLRRRTDAVRSGLEPATAGRR